LSPGTFNIGGLVGKALEDGDDVANAKLFLIEGGESLSCMTSKIDNTKKIALTASTVANKR
jgi:hypothetical protein